MSGDAEEEDVEPAPSARQATLRTQLALNREDLASWTVLADLLQSEDDPRGALISLMLERERSPSQKLYDAEVAYRAQHAKQLLPDFLRRMADRVAWRRGFPAAIPITSLEALGRTLSSPSLAFVESVHLDVSADEWDDWCAAVDGQQLPWRRIRLVIENAQDEIALASLLGAFPVLERIDVVFPQYDEGVLSWSDVSAPQLRWISIDNASEVVALDEAEVPALADIRLLGTATNAENLPIGPTILRSSGDEDEDNFEDREQAFIAIGQLVDASLVEEAATTLRGLNQLVVTTGHVIASPDSHTVIELRGKGDADLVPYGLAIALERMLAPYTPIVLFHSFERTGTARAFALGAHPFRKTDGDGRGSIVLRSMFDILVGRDPGPGFLADCHATLACADARALRGAAGEVPVLADIDPGSRGPLPEYDEEFEVGPAEHELELYEQPVEGAVQEIAESPALVDAVVELDSEVSEEEDVVAFEEGDDEEDEVDDVRDETSEGRDAWLRLLALWAERLTDPDDDVNFTQRWPDPEDSWNLPFDVDKAATEHACDDCENVNVLLYPCTWCGGRHCTSCTTQVEGGVIWCITCKAGKTEEPPTGYDDEIFDGYDDEIFDTVEPPSASVMADAADEYEEDWA